MTAAGPYVHPCHVCGDPHAPFGFGWPGLQKDRPDETVLWGCSLHRDEVQRINAQRTGQGPSR